MRQSVADLEGQLCAAYREEAALYAIAVALCEPSTEFPASQCTWLPDLVELLNRVASVENRIAGVKQAWQLQGQPTGPELRACLTRVADLLGPLSTIINRVIGAVETERQILIPEIDQFARVRRMQRAYGRTAHAT